MPIAFGAIALHLALGSACSPPDGEDLYAPLPSSGGAAATAGSAGSSGAGSGGAPLGGAGGAGGRSGSGGAAGQGGAAGSAGDGSAGDGSAGDGSAGGGAAGAGGSGSADPSDAGTSADSSTCSPAEEACNGLDDDCDGVVDPAGTCEEGCQGFALGTHAYMFCSEALGRQGALERCTAAQMNLAWIETADENAALVAAIAGLGITTDEDELLVQIGASDAEDEEVWVWVGNSVSPQGFQFWQGSSADDGGEPVGGAFQSWADGEPNDDNGGEDCAVMSVLGSDARDPGDWDDRSCDTAIAFVCEAP